MFKKNQISIATCNINNQTNEIMLLDFRIKIM